MWENIILTATNFAQAEVFESQLQRLRRAKVLDPEVRTWVIPDPDGQRIGSGGATFNAREVRGKKKEGARRKRNR